MKIKNANIILTGGSSGIGKETARQLVIEGANVVITGRNKERIESSAKEIGAIPMVFDISDFDKIKEKAQQCISLLNGKVDALINNAGIGVFPKLGTITLNNFQEIYNTNVFGLALLTQEIAEVFKAQNYGNIVNIGSTASLKGFVGGTVYASSKFAVRGMTQSWQSELRPFNIRVSLVNPSEVTTAFFTEDRKERNEEDNKLGALEIAHSIVAVLEMRDKGFIPELTVWATNPF